MTESRPQTTSSASGNLCIVQLLFAPDLQARESTDLTFSLRGTEPVGRPAPCQSRSKSRCKNLGARQWIARVCRCEEILVGLPVALAAVKWTLVREDISRIGLEKVRRPPQLFQPHLNIPASGARICEHYSRMPGICCEWTWRKHSAESPGLPTRGGGARPLMQAGEVMQNDASISIAKTPSWLTWQPSGHAALARLHEQYLSLLRRTVVGALHQGTRS